MGDVAGIHAFQLVFVSLKQLGKGYFLPTPGQARLGGGDTQDFAHHFLAGHFQYEAAIAIAKQLLQCHIPVKGHANIIAKGHLHNRLGNATHTGGVGCHSFTGVKELGHLTVKGNERLCLGQAVFILLRGYQAQGMAGCFQLRRYYLPGLAGGHRKTYQGGRHIQIFEAAAHGVLAADGADSQIQLGLESTQQGCQRLAPALLVLPQAFKVLLEGQVHLGEIRPGGNQLGNALHHSQVSTVVGALLGDEGIIAKGHKGAVVRMLLFHGDFLHHGLNGSLLILAAEGHQYRTGTDGGVKPLGKAPLGADIQILCQLAVKAGEAAADFLPEGSGLGRGGTDMLFCAVGVQEFPADVDDGIAIPMHHQSGLLRHLCHRASLEILFGCQSQEGIHVLWLYHHSHTLLGLGDGQLGAIQSLVFLGNGVEVNFQTVCQLTNGNRHTACAKVIAPLNQAAGLGIAEQPLKLPFLGSVTLLHLSTAAFQGFHRMGLGRTGGTAAAVPTGAAAQENHHISGSRNFSTDILRRGCSNYSTNLHPLGSIAWMVNFVHNAGGQTNLVTVRGVTGGSGGDNLSLGQLALNGLIHRLERICCAGDTHSTVHIGPAGQGVTDSAADTGGSTTEGLNFRGMVVGFVFEQQQPGLALPVHLHIDFHGTGVDFLALIQLGQLSMYLQVFYCNGSQIHQTDGLGTPQLLADLQIMVKGLLEQFIFKGNFVDDGTKGGMPAMVRPIGINHTDFRNGGLPALLPEISLAEGNVRLVHGKTILTDKVRQSLFVQLSKALHGGNGGGNGVLHLQGFRLGEGCLPGFHRVNHILLDFGDVCFLQISVQGVDLGGMYQRTLPLGDNLDTLGSRVRSLVKLTGQVLHSKHHSLLQVHIFCGNIQLRL